MKRKYLSDTQKRKIVSLIIQRDGGTRCLYCKGQTTPQTAILEHLNGDAELSILDNYAFSCQSCNKIKADGYDKRILNMAERKFDYNVNSAFVGENWPNSYEDEIEEEELLDERHINRLTWKIVREHLNNEIADKGSVLFNDTLDSLVFVCQERIKHGSDSTIRRHLNALTSSRGPYEKSRDESNQIVIVSKIRN